ncbi:MAG: hypothetical protein OEV08_07405 [Nitrospira sp.]|nr:hypothetical protein [Nitrospira sp.]
MTTCRRADNAKPVRLRIKTEQASGVVNGEDMDLALNDPIDDSVGALGDFSNGMVMGHWNDSRYFM